MTSGVGLGILSTDLCMWAATATPQMVEDSLAMTGHPVVKAAPNAVLPPSADAGILDRVNCWVASQPVLAGALVVAGYLVMRKR
jgi:hypothetical protein